ncbi:MAG TPA: methyltransferase [Pilimelia sp.]|nr:methyltransferase [Pilimelia sp.]
MPLSVPPEEAGQFPGAHLDMLGAVAFRAAGAGQRLGVFEALATGAQPPAALAERLAVDPVGIRILLDALVAFGYLTRAGGAYANSPDTTRWLLRTAPDSYAPVLSFWHTLLVERWTDLEESIRRGGPAGDFYAWLDKRGDAVGDFHTMLRRLAGWLAEEIVTLVAVPSGPASLLDLGGGHAGYPAAFCAAHPDLRAVVVDLPGALDQGRRTVDDAGLADRVELRPGDLFTADLSPAAAGEHDVALLFNVVHGYRPAEVATLLSRVAEVVRPGGTVALLEPLSDVPDRDPGLGEAFVRAFSLNLFQTQGGRTYAYEELAGLLTAAGFTDVEQRVLGRSPTDHLLTARRAHRAG